jgi:hypothetical protein
MGIVNYKEYHREFGATKQCLPLSQFPTFLSDSYAKSSAFYRDLMWIMVFETNLMFVAVPECYLPH